MTKEFKLNEILNAVNDINKINKKKNKNLKTEKIVTIKNAKLAPGKLRKLKESEILVLNEMIE